MQRNQTQTKLSQYEKWYIVEGIENSSQRLDGRELLEPSPIYLELNNLKQCMGSCRILTQDKTDVVVGVKLEVEPIQVTELEEQKLQGKVELEVECASSCSQKLDKKGLDYFTQYLNQSLSSLLFTSNIKPMLQGLCIVEGSARWVLYIDVLVLGIGGNLLDTISFGIRSALGVTKLPLVKVEDVGEGFQKAYEVSDDTSLYQNLPSWQLFPVIISLTKVGEKFLMDCTDLEEACAQATLHCSIDSLGDLHFSFKSVDGVIGPTMLIDMLQMAKTLGKKTIHNLDNICHQILKENQDTISQTQLMGF